MRYILLRSTQKKKKKIGTEIVDFWLKMISGLIEGAVLFDCTL